MSKLFTSRLKKFEHILKPMCRRKRTARGVSSSPNSYPRMSTLTLNSHSTPRFLQMFLSALCISLPCPEVFGAPEKKTDHVVISSSGPHRDYMSKHNLAVLDLALKKTQASYGPYKLECLDKPMGNRRALTEFSKPKEHRKINVHIAITSDERRKIASSIHIPIRMGLLSYRLIVTKDRNLKKFKNISSLDDFREISVGAAEHWIIRGILGSNDFNVVVGQKTDAIFSMLQKDRFDYVLRGVSEVFIEKDKPSVDFDHLVIEPSTVVYIPLPYYVMVDFDEPRLKQRLEEGLETMVKDGSMRALLYEFYGDSIKRARLSERQVFYIRNPYLVGDKAMERPELWYFNGDQFAKYLKDSYGENSVVSKLKSLAVRSKGDHYP